MTSELAQRAVRFEELIEGDFRDEQGLIRGALYAPTLRMWPAGYFDETRDVLRAPGLPEAGEWWAYEQTNITQGFYLLSLIHQYRVTGAAETLELARRTYEGIARVYAMTPGGERGFLCKPYGGRLSAETHADQYFPVAFALAAYWDCASSAERAGISEMLGGLAGYWLRQGYRLLYFGVPIRLAGRTLMNLLPLFGLAYRFTGEMRFREELTTRLGAILADLPLFEGGSPPDRIRSPFGRYFGWFMAVDYLVHEGYLSRERGEALLRDYWRGALGTIAADGMCYSDVAYDASTGSFYAPPAGYGETPLFEDRIHWDFVYWTGRLKSGFGTAGLAAAAVIGQQYLPDLSPVVQGARALQVVDEGALASYRDDSGDQLAPQHRWLGEDCRSDAAALWLMAYWSGRERGLWH